MFATQPYEQFAAVCRRAGQDTAARKVAIARRADLRRYGNLNPYRKVGNWLLDKTINMATRPGVLAWAWPSYSDSSWPCPYSASINT